MTTCVFRIDNNKLTTVSGADAGSYEINNNEADIRVSGVSFPIYPFNKPYFEQWNNGVLTVRIAA